jgi:hypothetical protein
MGTEKKEEWKDGHEKMKEEKRWKISPAFFFIYNLDLM